MVDFEDSTFYNTARHMFAKILPFVLSELFSIFMIVSKIERECDMVMALAVDTKQM
jgi:hypothetical protein